MDKCVRSVDGRQSWAEPDVPSEQKPYGTFGTPVDEPDTKPSTADDQTSKPPPSEEPADKTKDTDADTADADDSMQKSASSSSLSSSSSSSSSSH